MVDGVRMGEGDREEGRRGRPWPMLGKGADEERGMCCGSSPSERSVSTSVSSGVSSGVPFCERYGVLGNERKIVLSEFSLCDCGDFEEEPGASPPWWRVPDGV